jgi:hypothetical protein
MAEVTITRTKAEHLTDDIGEMIGIWPVLDLPDCLVGVLASMPVYSSRESICRYLKIWRCLCGN